MNANLVVGGEDFSQIGWHPHTAINECELDNDVWEGEQTNDFVGETVDELITETLICTDADM